MLINCLLYTNIRNLLFNMDGMNMKVLQRNFLLKQNNNKINSGAWVVHKVS